MVAAQGNAEMVLIAPRTSGDKMRFRGRMIATTMFAVSLTSALLIHAEAGGKQPDSAMNSAVDSRVVPGAAAPSGMTAPARHPRRNDGNPPRTELFLGYSHFQGVATLKTGNRMVGLNGGSATVTLNLNRYLGMVADFGGYGDTQLRLTDAEGAPPPVANASGSTYTYLFGPSLSYRKYNRISPFAQVLFGGVHATDVTLSGCTGSLCTPLPTQNAFAMTAGGGFDIRVFRHVSIRALRVEYMMTRFGSLTTEVTRTQNDLRLSSGLVLLLGGPSQHEFRAKNSIEQQDSQALHVTDDGRVQ